MREVAFRTRLGMNLCLANRMGGKESRNWGDKEEEAGSRGETGGREEVKGARGGEGGAV
jgi:hypothetical protein